MDIINQIKKIKYHQKLLLTIALDEEPEQYSFFHFVMNNDLSEKDSKIILNLLQIFEDKRNNVEIEIGEFNLLETDFIVSFDTFKTTLQKANINVEYTYLLKALKRQNIQVGLCDYLLS